MGDPNSTDQGHDARRERIHMPVSPGFVPDRTVVARPIAEAEASWWEDGTSVKVIVRREQMGETPQETMRRAQVVMDNVLAHDGHRLAYRGTVEELIGNGRLWVPRHLHRYYDDVVERIKRGNGYPEEGV